jgi:hypothetical protein
VLGLRHLHDQASPSRLISAVQRDSSVTAAVEGRRDRQKEWDIRASCPNGRSWGQCAKWGTYAHCYEKSTLSTHLSDLSSIATKGDAGSARGTAVASCGSRPALGCPSGTDRSRSGRIALRGRAVRRSPRRGQPPVHSAVDGWAGAGSQLSRRAVREQLGRWERAGWAERRRLLGHTWVTLTRAGLRLAGLDYEVWSPALDRLDHHHAAAVVRLHRESVPGAGGWVCERALWRRRGNASWHLADAALPVPVPEGWVHRGSARRGSWSRSS